MLELLGHYHHFPSRAEDCLVTLFLPKLDVKSTVSGLAPNYSSFPISLRIGYLLSLNLTRPVLDAEACNSAELTLIIGDKYQFPRDDLCRNQCI
jgi:hypothetical protein